MLPGPSWPHAQPRQPPTPPTQPLLNQQGSRAPPAARPLPSQPFGAPSAHQTPKRASPWASCLSGNSSDLPGPSLQGSPAHGPPAFHARLWAPQIRGVGERRMCPTPLCPHSLPGSLRCTSLDSHLAPAHLYSATSHLAPGTSFVHGCPNNSRAVA